MKKYMGFDFGDGESCLARINENSLSQPQIISVQGSESFLSAVGRYNGEIVIGDVSATLPGVEDLRVCFKRHFLSQSADVKKTVQDFASGVFTQAAAQIENINEYSITVGCPAGWLGDVRRAYLDILYKAGITQARLVSESRAAFLYARYSSSLPVNPKAVRESALVIDIGSSTLDFAYVVGGKESGVGTFGDTHLGGGVLDELIMADAVERVENAEDRKEIERALSESPNWRSRCLLAARRLKERYYSDEESYKSEACSAPFIFRYSGRQEIELRLTPDKADELINKPHPYLSGRSFLSALRDALTLSRQQTQEKPPQAVLLTGGASRMRFFCEECEKAFPDSTVVCCPEPQFSIARGLAYAARVDDQLAEFRDEVKLFTASDTVESLVRSRLPLLIPPLAQALTELAVTGGALPAVARWRAGETATLEEMQKEMSDRISALFSSAEGRDAMKEVLDGWTRSVLSEVQGKLSLICEKYHIAFSDMKFSLENVRSEAGRELSLGNIETVDLLNGVITVAVATISAALCGGGGIVLIAGGPVGALAGAVIGIVISLIGRKPVTDWLMRRDIRPLILRRVVTDSSVSSGRNRLKISRDIEKSLTEDSGFSDNLVKEISGYLDDYIRSVAEDTEIHIE
ncbi:MAG: Hsp70 family protein [Eubacteriales bacterium]|nr:Hsp70 family protein [Eubacteriales bacterium]MDD3882990.1 Hsp70 family protein [Eubacteriales bacterium]MDD4513462.1 Hsp70 family protein [Eubacteriales bacterium]